VLHLKAPALFCFFPVRLPYHVNGDATGIADHAGIGVAGNHGCIALGDGVGCAVGAGVSCELCEDSGRSAVGKGVGVAVAFCGTAILSERLSIMIGGFRGSTVGAVGDGIGDGGGWLKFTSTRITSDDRITIRIARAFRSI
jgi:hypothetical protein